MPLHYPARYSLKTPWNDGTTRVNLTRFHGVFAPNSKLRVLITPARWGKGRKTKAHAAPVNRTPTEGHAAMTWAQRLRRVFSVDITACLDCGGAMNVIVCIEDHNVIHKILTHLQLNTKATTSSLLSEPRASPASDFTAYMLFFEMVVSRMGCR